MADAPEMTPEAAAEYLSQAKTDPQLRNEILANRLSNPAVDRWHKAQEVAFRNPPAAPKPPPSPAPNTPEFVRTEINRSLADPAFVARPDAHQKLDEMLEREKALTPVVPIVDPTSAKSESEYRYHAPIVDTTEAVQLDGQLRAAALHVGLSAGEFASISEQAMQDVTANEGKTEQEIVEKLDQDLRGIFGPNYPAYSAWGERLVKEIEQERPGTLAMLDSLGLKYNRQLIVSLMQRAALKYQGRSK
jgi:hypothetical protein